MILTPFLFLYLFGAINAFRVPIQARSKARGSLTRRNGVTIKDSEDTAYLANITMGGEQKLVLLDTGSSDLWVVGDVPETIELHTEFGVSYAIGSVSGTINLADFQWENYTVDKQAYLLVRNVTNMTLQDGQQGLIGLGPDINSRIFDLSNKDTSFSSPLSRIFAQNMTSQNFLSLLLSRSNGTGDTFASGELTVSEIVPGFENITNMPKLQVSRPLVKEDQHFQVITDVFGITGYDGRPIHSHNSVVAGVEPGRLVAVLDSGFSFPQVPKEVADGFYSGVPGAQFSAEDNAWILPCDQYINVTFSIGGLIYPVHPLDTNYDLRELGSNVTVCFGPFQPIDPDVGGSEFDMILGMAFLRNTYSLFDFGDFVSDSYNDRGEPFVQLLSITDSIKAKEDFVRIRQGGQGSTSSNLVLGDLSEGNAHGVKQGIKKYWPYILAGGLVLLAAVAGALTWCLRGGRRGRRMLKGRAVMKGNSYKPLHAPAPLAAE